MDQSAANRHYNDDHLSTSTSDESANKENILESSRAVKLVETAETTKDDEQEKLFLGGYRNLRLKKDYHHGQTQSEDLQTFQKNFENLRTRETQTKQYKNGRCQRDRDCAAQMERSNIFLDGRCDRVMFPKPYENAEVYWEKRTRCIVIIQRYWRGYCARTFIRTMKKEESNRRERNNEKLLSEQKFKENERKIQRRKHEHPRSKLDFKNLYNHILSWRDDQEEKIVESNLPENGRQEACMNLLMKEVRLLQNVSRLKCEVSNESRRNLPNRKLSLMAEPKRWQKMDGSIVNVATPWTTRAEELKLLHQKLSSNESNSKIRIDAISVVKEEVLKYDCALSKELASLIDREIDLVRRGLHVSTMKGLRSRILQLFITFTEIPEFNPEASRFAAVPPTHQEIADEYRKSLQSIYC